MKIIQPQPIQTIRTLANLDVNYQNTPRIIKSKGVFHEEKSILLKMYDMYIIQPSSSERMEACEEFLRKEVKNKNINPYLGFGFAILSKDMLNVARWDTTYPIVLRNNVYEFQNEDLSDIKLLNIQDIGSFCAWELRVVGYEKEQWIKYLDSARTLSDKIKYLSSFYQTKK